MKLRIFLFLSVLTVLYSCGSSKKVATTKRVVNKRTAPQPKVVKKEVVKVVKPKPRVVTKEQPKVVYKPAPKVETVSKPSKTNSQTELTTRYIRRFSHIAVYEMHKYGIPASITLAQGVLESGNGRSELAVKSNNHFGIKCHKGWNGHSVSHDDDAKGECFRKYNDPDNSYEDHSLFLTSRKRYASLFKLQPTDYTGWAYGLKKAGYATDSKYPQKLISIINRYNLHEYDLMENTNPDIVKKALPKKKAAKNGYYYIVKKGDTLYSISKKNQVTVEELKANNNLYNNALSIGQRLYIH